MTGHLVCVLVAVADMLVSGHAVPVVPVASLGRVFTMHPNKDMLTVYREDGGSADRGK